MLYLLHKKMLRKIWVNYLKGAFFYNSVVWFIQSLMIFFWIIRFCWLLFEVFISEKDYSCLRTYILWADFLKPLEILPHTKIGKPVKYIVYLRKLYWSVLTFVLYLLGLPQRLLHSDKLHISKSNLQILVS